MNGITADCYTYDPDADKWNVLATMTEPRSRHGVVQINDNDFWIIGGESQQTLFFWNFRQLGQDTVTDYTIRLNSLKGPSQDEARTRAGWYCIAN